MLSRHEITPGMGTNGIRTYLQNQKFLTRPGAEITCWKVKISLGDCFFPVHLFIPWRLTWWSNRVTNSILQAQLQRSANLYQNERLNRKAPQRPHGPTCYSCRSPLHVVLSRWYSAGSLCISRDGYSSLQETADFPVGQWQEKFIS
jgi:hypothetical protein